MSTGIADRLRIGNEIRELKFGSSFTKNGNTAFHSCRYDFKPASVDQSKVASVNIGEGNQVQVTVPHIEGSGTSQTVFRGSKKPYQKECVLIIDNATGEITLERLTSNIQLKKTRAEGSSKVQGRPITPIDQNISKKPSPPRKNSPNQKSSSVAAPGPSYPSPNHWTPVNKSPPTQHSPSMPAFGSVVVSSGSSVVKDTEGNEADVGILSDSSDSSNSSASSDESDSEKEPPPPPKPVVRNPVNHQGASASYPNMPKFSQLNEDLQLSESASDSEDDF